MSWFRIDKSQTQQPAGKYNNWKEIIRLEARQQCVYCAINEAGFGGVRNFHIDHYRPKKKFAELEHVIENLFYACAICNAFKGADWPAEPLADHSICAYPNPSEVDYSDLLVVDDEQLVRSNFISGKYVVERLYINRPQLVMWRQRVAMMADLEELSARILDAISASDLGGSDATIAVDAVKKAMVLMRDVQHVAPYESADTRRD